MRETFKKKERLKSRKLIRALFEKGQSIKKFPLRLIFLKINASQTATSQVSFAVSKRNFKKAVTRNRIKRMIREAYRLEKKCGGNDSNFSYAFMITYMGRKEPTFSEIQQKVQELFALFTEIQNQKQDA